MRNPGSENFPESHRRSGTREIHFLNLWIERRKPQSGFNAMSLPPLLRDAPVACLRDAVLLGYARASRFGHLPISRKTKRALREGGFVTMTDAQRASIPHALCGRDTLSVAKSGSGKTLAFIIPVLENLFRKRWGPDDGIGAIIISPARESARQILKVLKSVGKYHNLSAGLLIDRREHVDTEKEQHVNELNILICTPGRLLQHLDETPNFDCSRLQILVLDGADHMLDIGFEKPLDEIISQLPKHRQTLLFSATETESVEDLRRVSLQDPEYLTVHEDSVTATPVLLIVVSLDKKLDQLWHLIKANLRKKIVVFFSSCQQVEFVYQASKKLHAGIPWKRLHAAMKQEKRTRMYDQFCEQRSVLFCTDEASKGLDFKKAADYVIQVDCPEDVASYVRCVGHTASDHFKGRSILFLMPSEMKMLEKLQAANMPIHETKADSNKLQTVSGKLASLLVRYPNMQRLAKAAFTTYLQSIHIKKDKEIFDVMKLPVHEFSSSLGLSVTPEIQILSHKSKDNHKEKRVREQKKRKKETMKGDKKDVLPEGQETGEKAHKRLKICFKDNRNQRGEDKASFVMNKSSVADQEEYARKLLTSMHL